MTGIAYTSTKKQYILISIDRQHKNTYNVYYAKSTGMCVCVCDGGVYYLLLRKCSTVLLLVG